MRFRNVALIVVGFAVAMAYMESAVVVYLQRAIGLTPEELFPLRQTDVVGNLVAIEVGRELATLVMLVALGCLVGRRAVDRLAWTAVAFGVWDIFYYVWLWVFIGWPHGLNTWDVLFLIPVPWAGPVWTPMAVSLALVGAGLAAAHGVVDGCAPVVTTARGIAAVSGGLLVVASFVSNAPSLLAGEMPGWFPWPVFVAGMALAGWAAVASLRAPSAVPAPAVVTGD